MILSPFLIQNGKQTRHYDYRNDKSASQIEDTAHAIKLARINA
jgi:hypothetical protein